MTRDHGGCAPGTVRPVRRRSCLAAFLTALAVGSSACGAGVDAARAPADGSPPAVGSGGVPERITPAGVAAVVSDHLGDAVRRFGTYDPEEGSVGVLVELRGGSPADHFIVSVWSPDQRLGDPEDRSCRPDRGEAPAAGDRTCRRLDDGTIVEVFESEAFSDDGTGVFPEGGASLAMYESYDRSAPLGSATLAALLSDPRLRWLTDPAVNAAGTTIDVERLGG
jgi:hypothetical protein